MEELSHHIERVVNEATYCSNIAYLPSGFVTLKRHLATLAAMKGRWKIQILECSPTSNLVTFEDQLAVKVRKRHMDSFLENFLGVHPPVGDSEFEIDLASSITEAKDVAEIVDGDVRRLEKALLSMLQRTPFKEVRESWNAFVKLFGSHPSTSKTVAISIEDPQRTVLALVQRARLMYVEDLGGLQQLVSRIEDDGPVVGEDLFKGYENLYGSTLQSNYQGTPLKLEVGVMVSRIPFGSLEIDNDKVADEVEGKEVKVTANIAYPRNKFFSSHFFKQVRDEIATGEEAEQKTPAESEIK